MPIWPHGCYVTPKEYFDEDFIQGKPYKVYVIDNASWIFATNKVTCERKCWLNLPQESSNFKLAKSPDVLSKELVTKRF